MKKISGIAASPGIAIGEVFLHLDDSPSVPQYTLAGEEQVAQEVERLRGAIDRTDQDIRTIIEKNSAVLEKDEQAILEAHLLILQDPTLFDSVRKRMREDRQNVEYAVHLTLRDLVKKLNASGDPYLRERTADLRDVAKRVLNHLLEHQRTSLEHLSSEVVLVTHDLLPSEVVAMDKSKVQAIVMDAGGKTSHTAILARSFEIPAVVGLRTIAKRVTPGECIIVDGNHGLVIIDPDDATIEQYRVLQRELHEHESQLMRLHSLPGETTDGKRILLNGNIEVPEEVPSVLSHGADGIGLYRSEFLFLGAQRLPTEEEQFQAYRSVVSSMGGKTVTIRTLDVGGDKMSALIDHQDEKNPILGWRAIRMCLTETNLFKVQLRAILRASAFGPVQIMFPMISGVPEFTQALDLLAAVRQELEAEEVPFAQEIPVGIMIEVPSAALTADALAKKADFFSIGTNDLIQYTMAVDRGNEQVAYLYEPFHPGLLRLIRMTIESGHAEGIPVAMCGEMAGDPRATVVLLGLGLDQFSMSAVGVPEVKRIIRSTSLAEAEELAGSIMEMRSAAEIDEFVRRYMNRRFGLEL